VCATHTAFLLYIKYRATPVTAVDKITVLAWQTQGLVVFVAQMMKLISFGCWDLPQSAVCMLVLNCVAWFISIPVFLEMHRSCQLKLYTCVCVCVCVCVSWVILNTVHTQCCKLLRHVSFMHLCDCHMFHLLSHFFAYISKVRICHIFRYKLAFSTAVLILFLLPISITFRFITSTIWLPTEWPHPFVRSPDPCGTRWGSWFQAALYHISAAYLMFMRSTYFI